jgi:hypothetical protein
MFHLFKRVYVELDDAVDTSVNRIVISEINGVPLMESLSKIVPGKLILFAKSIDEIIGAEKQYQTLLNFLEYVDEESTASDRKIVIYCDRNTYLKLTTSWLKILLPNITVGSAYGIVTSYMFNTRMFGTSELVPFTRAYRMTQADYTITLEDFVTLFSNINIERDNYTSFISRLNASVSIEFLLASYWYNGSYKEELKSVAKGKVSIGMQQFLYEAKTFIVENILNTPVIERFHPQKVYDLSNLTEMFTDSAFDVWFDNSIWNVESIGMPHTYSDINYKNITAEYFNKLESHLRIWVSTYNNTACTPQNIQPGVNLEDWMTAKLRVLRMCILDEVTDSDLEFLLDQHSNFEIPAPCDTMQIFEWVETEKFNPFLITFLRKAMLARETNVLRVYSLV